MRDQFAVELGKIPPSARSGDEAIPYCPKWPYFKFLLFLKDVVTPREPIRRMPRTRSVVVDQNTESTDSLSVQDSEDDDDDNNQHSASASKRYKKAYDEKIFNIENQKLQFLREKEKSRQNLQTCKEEDENVLFFKSLLPHVNKIPHHKLLSFRTRIQNIVEELAYKPQLAHTCLDVSMSSYSNLSDNAYQNPSETYHDSNSPTLVVSQTLGDMAPASSKYIDLTVKNECDDGTL